MGLRTYWTVSDEASVVDVLVHRLICSAEDGCWIMLLPYAHINQERQNGVTHHPLFHCSCEGQRRWDGQLTVVTTHLPRMFPPILNNWVRGCMHCPYSRCNTLPLICSEASSLCIPFEFCYENSAPSETRDCWKTFRVSDNPSYLDAHVRSSHHYHSSWCHVHSHVSSCFPSLTCSLKSCYINIFSW